LFSSFLGFCHDEISQNPVGKVISGTAFLKIINKSVMEYLKKAKIIALAIFEKLINSVEYVIWLESVHSL